MTRTFSVSLGSSTLSGKQAIDQTRKFKEQLRSIYDKPDSVSLITVVNENSPHMGVVAFYDADSPVDSAWVRHAQRISAELWQTIAERRNGPVR